MFLNDAFDAAFDRHHRRTRPIPSGRSANGRCGSGGSVWLALGLASASLAGADGRDVGGGPVRVHFILQRRPQMDALGPFLMGMCRLGVYLLAASAARRGVSGEVIWKGLALAAYIVGLSCLARKESSRVRINFWPSLLLATPVVFAGLIDDGSSWMPAVVYSLVVAAWSSWALSRSLGQPEPNVGYTVSRLLAGIVLVDLLAVASSSEPWIGCFAVWFALALLLQRFIPRLKGQKARLSGKP
jgi:hypothetical protein